jgi:hypothetical protein
MTSFIATPAQHVDKHQTAPSVTELSGLLSGAGQELSKSLFDFLWEEAFWSELSQPVAAFQSQSTIWFLIFQSNQVAVRRTSAEIILGEDLRTTGHCLVLILHEPSTTF